MTNKGRAEFVTFVASTLPRIKAFIEEGKLDDGVLQFSKEIKRFIEQIQDERLLRAYKRIEGAQGAKDIWQLLRFALILFEDSSREETVLGMLALICYLALVTRFIRRAYDSAQSERSEVQKVMLDRRKTVLGAWGSLPNLGEALHLFNDVCSRLARIQGEESQAACVGYETNDDIWFIHEQAIALLERYGDQEVRQWLPLMVVSSSELIVPYSIAGDLERAQKLYEHVRQGLETYGEEELELVVAQSIVTAQAKGAINLVHAYVSSGQPDPARAVYEDLCELIQIYCPENASLRFGQANRAADIVYAYAIANRPEEAQAVYQHLRDLVREHPEEPRLRMWQAEGALDLASVYINNGRPEEAKEIFLELEKLAGNSDVALKVRERKSRSGVPAIDRLRELLYGS